MTVGSVTRYGPELKDAWDGVVRNSKNGTFLHLRDYMDYHADRFTDCSLLFQENGKVVAVFPCSAHGDSVVSHGGLTYGGLIYGKDVHATTVLSMFDTLAEHFKAAGFQKVVYKPVPRVFHTYPADEDLYALFRMSARLYRRDLSSVIELATRPKFSDSRKNTARKAPKAGARFEEIDDTEGFHALLASVLARFGSSPVHSVAELRLLKSRFPENIRLFGVLLEDRLLAASLVFDLGPGVHTQYMAASDEGRALGALDFLLVNLIENTFSEKQYLSFGISTEQQGQFLNEGLIKQKEGFGGRGMVHDFYEWDL
ncbi:MULTISPECIES: GNAT family N-acetyltransferase [Pandoraea]|uniref:GNAT family N-acetyltransferase n=1 Tax=Pandoraea TaxID=93217 RepID=UPI001F5D5C1A|nr:MULTISPECIES: GNAT family N-acetyltransferase [Pandoraea]MCI3204944.1 GNAT family N-acetyltransferase [Pandoraea sp. LA3]MDN4582972.1 GNAT family N-acetyltransferase [Pandoraea capi]